MRSRLLFTMAAAMLQVTSIQATQKPVDPVTPPNTCETVLCMGIVLNAEEVFAGQLIEATANGFSPHGRDLKYFWEVSEGVTVIGDGPQVLISTDKLTPGEYHVGVIVSDGESIPMECTAITFRVLDPDSMRR